MQIYLFSTRYILQSELRVEDNKNSSPFCDNSGNIVLLATPNLWNNIQIVRICIFKYNIFNPVSFVTRYLDIKTSYNYFGHISDEVIYYILDNVKNVKKIYFPVHKYIYHYYTFGKIYQYNLSKNVMRHLNTNNFIFLFFYFSDFILILFFLFFFFWTMKRHMIPQSHDRSHDVTS